MLAQLWQIERKDLLEKLDYFAHTHILKCEKLINRELRRQSTKCCEGHDFVHALEKKQGCNIRHSLHITDVRSEHSKRIKHFL